MVGARETLESYQLWTLLLFAILSVVCPALLLSYGVEGLLQPTERGKSVQLPNVSKSRRVYPKTQRQPQDGLYPFTEQYEQKCFADQGMSTDGLSRAEIDSACQDWADGSRRAQHGYDRVEPDECVGGFHFDDDLHDQLREGEREFAPDYDSDCRWSFSDGPNDYGWTSKRAS